MASVENARRDYPPSVYHTAVVAGLSTTRAGTRKKEGDPLDAHSPPDGLAMEHLPSLCSQEYMERQGVVVSAWKACEKKEKAMLNERLEALDEVSAVIQEKGRVEKQITMLRQDLLEKETWLNVHASTTQGYQEVLGDWQALQAYVTDLYAQVVSLDEALQDLHPNVPVPSVLGAINEVLATQSEETA